METVNISSQQFSQALAWINGQPSTLGGKGTVTVSALEEIFNALHGEDWSDSENWCTDAPLKQWSGVMTNTYKGEEHVTYLHLQCLGAHGTLPDAIGELRYLRELWIIGDEGITGNLPASLGNLTELRDLSISGTSIGGEIPSCLSFLRKLEILGLDGNCLTGNLPLFLCDMPALYNFGFSHCSPRVSPPVDTFPASFVLL